MSVTLHTLLQTTEHQGKPREMSLQGQICTLWCSLTLESSISFALAAVVAEGIWLGIAPDGETSGF